MSNDQYSSNETVMFARNVSWKLTKMETVILYVLKLTVYGSTRQERPPTLGGGYEDMLKK